MKKCIRCKKLLKDYRSKRCKSCAKKGKNNPMYGCSGELNPNWVGKGKMKNGYIRVSIPGKRMRVYEHRFIFEKILNRKLKRTEVIHHINSDRTDNRIENLELITAGMHVNIHKPAKGHKCNNQRNKLGQFIKK